MPVNAAGTVPESGDSPGARARRRRGAFTLIELLIVVAILAALVTIIMPAISSALEMSRQSVCLNNHRAILSALQSYHTEYNTFPYNYGWYGPYKDEDEEADTNERWALGCIASHLTGTKDTPVYLRRMDEGQFPNAYICPSADLDEVYADNPDDKYHACYWTNVAIRVNRGFGDGRLFNDWSGGGNPPGWDGNSGGEARFTGLVCKRSSGGCGNWRSVYNPTMRSVPLPAQTVFTGDTNNKDPGETGYDADGQPFTMYQNAYTAGFWHVRPGWTMLHGGLGFDRHNDRLLMGYLDGNAKAVTHRWLEDNFPPRPSGELKGDWFIPFPKSHNCTRGDRFHHLPTVVVE